MTEKELLTIDTRRKLLPIWIKIFLWIFIVFGAFAPLGLLLGVLGFNASLSLYGLETTEPLSAIGLIIVALFMIKGMVSFGLWTEKDWAVDLAIIDAILGIIACFFVIIILPSVSESEEFVINFRLELVALIPYLIKMIKIKPEWVLRKA